MKKKTFGKLIAAVAAAAAMAIPAYASSTDSYILFLPTSDAISYEVDQSHVSSEYSTDDYTILLYKPGEVVSLGVDTDYKYYVEDAMETTTYASYEVADDNAVSFIMPEEDILFVVKDEAGNPLDAAELSAQSEAPAETAAETSAETQAENAAAQGVGFKMNEEAGTLSVQIKGGIKAEIVGADGSSTQVDKENGYRTGGSIDIITVTSDGGQWDNPEFKLYRNSEEVTDTSDIIINSGGWNGEFKIDLKNAWTPSDGAWTLTIKENGYVEETEAPAETVAEETTAQVEETETEPEPEIGAGAMLSAFGGGETEAVAEETTEAPAPETNAFLTDVAPEDFPQFGETEAPEESEPAVETAVETPAEEPETETQVVEAVRIPEETPAETAEVQTESSEFQTEIQTETAEVQTETAPETAEETEQETEAKPVKAPEFYQGEIDMEIPFNYVPVPGRDDVFMVLNRDGEVEDFKILVRDGDEIKWEELIPSVVDVPELEDVYAVSDADGNMTYFKYARRTNSTYTFIETDENGNPL